jgi:hypothetical protein
MPILLPWPRRRTGPPPCNAPLAEGETVVRGQRCTLLYGRERKRGVLHLTDRRVIFQAERGDARWLIIPLEDVARAGAYRTPGGAAFQLWVETANGEHAPFAMARADAQAWAKAIEALRRPGAGERLLE